jgi:ubiquinone/menaquinone biosynthesis C-methylase UbiE
MVKGVTRINLGAGSDIRKGWCNVDIRPGEGIDVVSDGTNLPFDDNSANKIYASDVLEHIMYAKVAETLKEWYRVLAPKGTITLKVPSLSTIAMHYVRHDIGCKEFVRLVYGGQQEGNIANAHKSGFDPQYLSLLMKKAGFKIAKIISHPDLPDQNNFVIIGEKVRCKQQVK